MHRYTGIPQLCKHTHTQIHRLYTDTRCNRRNRCSRRHQRERHNQRKRRKRCKQHSWPKLRDRRRWRRRRRRRNRPKWRYRRKGRKRRRRCKPRIAICSHASHQHCVKPCSPKEQTTIPYPKVSHNELELSRNCRLAFSVVIAGMAAVLVCAAHL